jgi:hypothetical protein
MAETTQVVTMVANELNKTPAHARTPLYENWLLSKETLKLASTSDEGKEDPQLGEILLGKFTPDELQAIWKQYQKGLEMCDPSLEELDPEKLKALVEIVKKNPSLTPTELSFLELVAVCQELSRAAAQPDS